MPSPHLASAKSLRERLHETAIDPTPYDIVGDEGRDRDQVRRTPAAVLIGLVRREAGLSLLLTQRTAHLSAHAGQISLPGGRMEPEDTGPAATALREAQEEIGLDPAKVEVLGGLRAYDTSTGFRVHPIVGWIEPPVAFEIDPFEVAEMFEVPLAFVIDPANQRRDSFEREGRRRHYWVIPYEHRYIWGATAGILVGFAKLLNG